MTDRVAANFSQLDNYVIDVVGLTTSWAAPMKDCDTALWRFFNSSSAYGPTSSTIPISCGLVADDYRLMGIGVAATSEAFKQIDALLQSDELAGSVTVTDEGVESLRRAYLQEEWPEVADLLAETGKDAQTVLEELEEVQEDMDTFWDTRGGGAPDAVWKEWQAQYDDLLTLRSELAGHAVIHIEQLQDEIEERRATGGTPYWNLTLRDNLVQAITGDEEMTKIAISYLDANIPVREALFQAEGEMNYQARIDAVMVEQGVSETQARTIIEEVDQITIQLMAMGHSPEAAGMAGVIGQAHGLTAADIAEVAEMFNTNVADGAAIHVQATERDMTPAQFGTYVSLQVHFKTIAQDGDGEAVITRGDLNNVINNPDDFPPEVLTTVQKILEDPAVYFRLDNAAANNDILDSDSFGALGPDDWKVGEHEFAAFELKQHINNFLGEWGVQIDTANGGVPDGYFSGNDYRHFLDNLPAGIEDPEHARELLTQIIEGKMYDQSWLESHMDELIMLAAVVAGVGAFFLTAGAATPLLLTLAAGFAAGATTAGVLTLGGNHLTGNDLTEGLAGNMIRGGFGGMAGAALPMSIGGLSAATGGYSTTVASLGLASDVTGIIALGGTDIILPEDWESGVHDVTGVLSLATGVGAITMVGGRLVLRATPPVHNPRAIMTDIGGENYLSQGDVFYGQGSVHGNRALHLEAHLVDDLTRVNARGNPIAHGVFTTDNVYATVDDAVARIRANGPAVIPNGPNTYIVAMDEAIGYVGGPVGNAMGRPPTRWVRVVLGESDVLISAHPVPTRTVFNVANNLGANNITPTIQTALDQSAADLIAGGTNLNDVAKLKDLADDLAEQAGIDLAAQTAAENAALTTGFAGGSSGVAATGASHLDGGNP